MMIRPKFRNAALLGALTAVAVSSWATNAAMSSTYVPASYVVAPAYPMPAAPVVVSESLAPDEVLVTADAGIEASDAVVVPLIERRVTIEERRLSEDERIQAVVMDRLANNPRLSGKIGVESHNAVVTLSGYTSTVGQARHAERDARGVIGVRYVQNGIRARVGGSV